MHEEQVVEEFWQFKQGEEHKEHEPLKAKVVLGQLEIHELLYKKEPVLHEVHTEKEVHNEQVTGQDEQLRLVSSGKVAKGQLEPFTHEEFMK